jgi:citronellol/citronellal dehydrogenase
LYLLFVVVVVVFAPSFESTMSKQQQYKSIFSANLFHDQVILVTGGATGIGKCAALELATLGATVTIASRKEETLKKTQEEFRALGFSIDYVVADIKADEQVERMVQSVLRRHGRIDGVVNSAGGQFYSMAEDISNKGWNAVVNLNLNGTWNVCKKVFDLHMREHGGSIVNIVADMW